MQARRAYLRDRSLGEGMENGWRAALPPKQVVGRAEISSAAMLVVLPWKAWRLKRAPWRFSSLAIIRLAICILGASGGEAFAYRAHCRYLYRRRRGERGAPPPCACCCWHLMPLRPRSISSPLAQRRAGGGKDVVFLRMAWRR